jgi:hypothetical protein
VCVHHNNMYISRVLLTHTHTHTHTHTNTHTNTHTHTHTTACSGRPEEHTHFLTRSLTLSRSRSLARSLALSLSLSLPHTQVSSCVALAWACERRILPQPAEVPFFPLSVCRSIFRFFFRHGPGSCGIRGSVGWFSFGFV